MDADLLMVNINRKYFKLKHTSFNTGTICRPLNTVLTSKLKVKF
jgi:hypothetical protein